MTSSTPPGRSADAAAGGTWRVVVPDAVATSAHRRSGAPPSFSVVVAAYQAGSTIAAALDSVLAQTHPPREIVVCDDGSTDETAAVLRGFGDAVTTVRQPNRGEAAAKNAAVQRASGDYVVVLDADDVFHPRRLEALGWLASRRPDLDILTTDAGVEADGVPVRRAYHPGWPFPRDDQRSAILDRNFVFGLCAVRRERWLAAGGFDEDLAYAADWEFWQRLILSGSRVGLVDQVLASYRLSSGTLSSDRLSLVRARIVVLQRAAAHFALTPSERVVVQAAIRRERRELRIREAYASLDRGGWPARSKFAKVLFGRHVGVRVRFRALRAVVSPAWAARRSTGGGTVEIGAGLRVPRDPGGAR